MKKVKDVDEYISHAPQEVQEKLNEMRKAIKEVAPNSEEKISYGMPYYGYKGRLVYWGLWKEHIGLYIPPPVIDEHKKELKDYKTAKATIQFPLSKKLPLSLIKKLIKTRVKLNEEREKKK